MQVTHVKPKLVDPGSGKNWLFVKVDSDAGINGWGQCYTQADRDQSSAASIRSAWRIATLSSRCDQAWGLSLRRRSWRSTPIENFRHGRCAKPRMKGRRCRYAGFMNNGARAWIIVWI